jgi:hypothetical protein
MLGAGETLEMLSLLTVVQRTHVQGWPILGGVVVFWWYWDLNSGSTT